MTPPRESQHLDRKSLRQVAGSTANFSELAQDCVCFANGAGGTLLVGIEDDADAPPASQRVEPALLDRIRKRVGELTVNGQVVPELKRHDNGGEYIALTIPRAAGVASTSDGRYFLRVGDTCRPIVGDDVMRLASERPAPHRLRALIIEDLERFPDSLSKDIRRRVGQEIPDRTFRRALEALVQGGRVQGTGETRWRKYRLTSLGRERDDDR